MSTEYEIVQYSPEHKTQILELVTHLLGPDTALNRSHFEWKYETNPYIESPLFYLALSKGKVVGMRGMYGSKWEFGRPSQTICLPCACGLVFDPDHRNKGLFTKIMAYAYRDLSEKGYPYIFNLSAGPVTRLASLASGWRSAGDLRKMFWKPTPWMIRLRRMKRFVFSLFSQEQAKPFDHLDRRAACISGTSELQVSRNLRAKEMAGLMEKIGCDARIHHARDEEYFLWRFGNPLSEYRFLYWGKSELQGYIALQSSVRKRPAKLPAVTFVDWGASNDETLKNLLAEALVMGNFHTVSVWSSMLLEETQAFLKKLGFQYVRSTGKLDQKLKVPSPLVRAIGRNLSDPPEWKFGDCDLMDPHHWNVRMIDSDAY